MAGDSKNKDGFIVEMQKAEIAKYSPEERREYEVSVKNYWDYNSTMKTAVLNEKKKIAQNLKAMNVMNTVQIAEATGLPPRKSRDCNIS